MKKLLLLGLLILSLNITGQIPIDGLVGHWTFNGNANDETGVGNDGIIYGAELTEDRCDNPNSAFSFDGDDYIECTDYDMDITNAVSISLWFKTTTTGYDALLSKYSWTQDYGYVAQFDAIGSPEIRGRDGNDVFSESETDGIARNDEKWHHFVGIVDGSTWTTYIDTTLISSMDNNHSNVDISSCSLPLIFGRLGQHSSTSWRHYTGTLDDIAIYNRAITEEEILQLYMDDCTPIITTIEESIPTESIKIYPNPTNGKLTFEIDNQTNEIESIRILDSSGREIAFDQQAAIDNGTIDISNEPKGIYILRIKVGNSTLNQRIVLK